MSLIDETASDLPVKDTDCKPAVIRAIQELATGPHIHRSFTRTTPKIKEKDLKIRRRVCLISREELEDNFLRLHEENLILKDYARKQEDKIKRMGTKLMRLTAELGKAGENKSGSARKDGRDLDAEETIENLQDRVRDLERRNEALRNRVTTFKQRLQFQDGCRHCPYSAITARIDSGVRRNATLSDRTRRGVRVQGLEKRPPRVYVEDIEEALSDEARAEIDRLFHVVENRNCKVDDRSATLLKSMVAMRSKDVEAEVMLSLQRMQQTEEQRTALQDNVMHIRLQKELREKNTSLCALKEQFQQLKESYETELEEKQKSLTLSHKAVLIQLEDLSTQLKQERSKVVGMEADQQSLLNLQKSLCEFQERVNDLEKEKELIKEQYESLLKSTMESESVTNWQKTEKELQEQLLQQESQTHMFLHEHTQIKNQLLQEREQKEHLMQEVSQLQNQLLEKNNEILGVQEKVSVILSSTTATRIERDVEIPSHGVQFIQDYHLPWSIKKEEHGRLRIINELTERREDKGMLENEENTKQGLNEEQEPQEENSENRTDQEDYTKREQEKSLERKIHSMDAAHAETILELEKTREMLIMQHKINVDYQDELKVLRLRAENESREREDTEHKYKERLLQRDSRVKVLEEQLKDIAYGTFPTQVIGKDDSSGLDTPQPLVLQRGEAVFEVHIGSVCFSPRGLRDIDDPQPVTFCLYSFYVFETHATPAVAGARPQYDFTSSYAVVPDPEFLRYLRVGTLTVELYQVIGSEHHELARARLPLEGTLQSTDKVHNATVLTDACGEVIGELDYWLRLHGPLPQTQRLQRHKAFGYLSTLRQGTMSKSTVLQPNHGTQNVLVIRIWGCRRLWGGRIGYQPSPYAVYRFYHYPDHSTCIIPCSNNPQFGDETLYPIPLTMDLEQYLQKGRLNIYVFDDEETKPGSYLGRAEVPLLTLAQGNSIQGDFVLLDPVGKCSGSAQVSLEWKFPYKAPGRRPWDSVTKCQPPLENVERTHPHKNLQGKELFREASKVHLSRPRPPKSRRAEDSVQWDTHSTKRGRRDSQPVSYHRQELLQRSDSLHKHQNNDLDMDLEEIVSGHEVEPQQEEEEQEGHMVEQESNESVQDVRLSSALGKDKTVSSHRKDTGDQPFDGSDSESTDSDEIIILEPHVPQKPCSSRIRVEIASLTLDPYSEVVADDTVQRVFVEFRFPGVPMEETETPISLHKPTKGEEVYFHFSKVIHIDGVEHTERRQFLYTLLKDSDTSGQRHRLQFTVVSDPIKEEQECRDLGYAYLDLQFLLRRSVDPVEETLHIVNVLDETQVIGALRVSVEARDAARAIYREHRSRTNISPS